MVILSKRISFNNIGLVLLGIFLVLLYAAGVSRVLAPGSGGPKVDVLGDERSVDAVVAVKQSAERGPRSVRRGLEPLAISDVSNLEALFDGADYEIADIASGRASVPRILLANLPSDLPSETSVETRKSVFLKTVLPLVLVKNEEIRTDRRRLLEARARLARGEVLVAGEQSWLNALYDRYQVRNGDLEELLRRVDLIPPSLALAQAAKESGWGTSRFAQEGNALFGQWTWREEDGMAPRNRARDERHFVRSFDHLLDSVRAYVLNLNTHQAYKDLREMRAAIRARGGRLDGHSLAGALTRYSALGQVYVDGLRDIIRTNELASFDEARLGGFETTVALRPLD